MIRYLGDFSYDFRYRDQQFDQKNTKESHEHNVPTLNILLEYGDCNLGEYFAERFLPPVTFEEILRFWKDLVDIPRAVRDLHYLERDKGGKKRRYWGYVPSSDIRCED
jgi:hypothetical protein